MRFYGNLTNRLMEASAQPAPEVGMGATECMWSDRHAYTIIKLKSPCRILVQRDRATRTDDNGMSECQSYNYEADPNGSVVELIKTKKGWKILGGGSYFLIGVRDEYYDFSF